MSVKAVVWGVTPKKRKEYPYGDVEKHQEYLKENGAVYWGASWKRCYTEQPVNGYLYIVPDAVKYKLKIERIFHGIISKGDEESNYVPPFRCDYLGKMETWIKITEITELSRPVDPTEMIKYNNNNNNNEPIGNGDKSKARSALQSAIWIIDEFWK